jgi:hypothetical protein
MVESRGYFQVDLERMLLRHEHGDDIRTIQACRQLLSQWEDT